MRYAGVASTMQRPGTTELEMAKGVQALVGRSPPRCWGR